jgi:hypothetical protein
MKHLLMSIGFPLIVLLSFSTSFSEPCDSSKVYYFQFNSFTGFFNRIGENYGEEIPIGFEMIAGYKKHRIGMFFNFAATEWGWDDPSYLFDYYFCPYSGKHAEIGLGITSGVIQIKSTQVNLTLGELISNLSTDVSGLAIGPAFESSFGYRFIRIVVIGRLLISNRVVLQLGTGLGLCFKSN